MKASRFQLNLGFALACTAITFSLAVRAQAQTVSYLASFDGTNGYQPFGSLTQATDGNIYGTTTNGGGHGYGNVYRITPSGEITSIYNFCKRPNCADGTTPESAPVLGSDGNLYGTTTGIGYGYGTVYKMTLTGKLTTLYTFCSLAECADGSTPNGLIQASDGNCVIYRDAGSGAPIWATNTLGNPGDQMVMQDDGNLVLYDVNGNPLWASNTAGQ